MDEQELLDFINQDDARIVAEQQLEESKRQTELLEQVAAQTKGSLNDYVNVIEVDLNDTHDSFEVYRWREGDPKINTVVIPAQLVNYIYEVEPGKQVHIDAGLIMDITGHEVDMLWITNSSTVK